MRLNKFIATHTNFSRRKADELISKGVITINDKKVDKLGTQIDPQKDIVKINNNKVSATQNFIYIALNKPAGMVTTREDEFGRKIVTDLIPKNLNLKPAGRLDFESEGLLLFSNDGDFIFRVTHPRFEHEKEYFVTIKGILKNKDKEKLEKGLNLKNIKTSPAKIKIIKEISVKNSQETLANIIIHEGKKRQIRNMFACLGYPVKYLQRIRIGNVVLGDLKKGQFRNLTEKEIKCFLA